MVYPTPQQLRALLRDRLASTEADRIESHIQSCGLCREALDSLSDDGDLRNWRDGSPAPPALGRSSEWFAPPLAPPQRPGDLGRLGTHYIEKLLGKGGMGYVFQGWDESLNRPVAIKVLRPDLDSPEARERFLQEARTAAGLRHKHIVTVFGTFDPPDGLPYFTMELLSGVSLGERLKAGPLPAREAVELIAQAAEGIAAAHAAGIIHRDIKPANLLVEAGTGLIKVADFGLARDAIASSGLTQEGFVVGSPHYLSPEQAAGETRLDARTDIYSLGVTLYESLTGATPFRGTPLAVLRQIRNDLPVPPRRLNAEAPRDPEIICLKAMSRDINRRYPTAAAFGEDLRRWLDGLPIAARPSGRIERSILWSKRNRPAVGAILLFLVGFIASTWGWLQADHNARESRAFAAEASQREEEAIAARLLANQKASLADERALLALRSVNTLVFKANQLADNTPGTLLLKRQLTEAALADLQKLAASGERSAGADHTQFVALMKLGETLALLGRTADAVAQWEKAAALADSLSAASPDDPAPRRDRGAALIRVAYIHRRNGNTDEAALFLLSGIASLESAIQLSPADQPSIRELAVAFNSQGDLEQQRGAGPKALASYRRALALVEGLSRMDPKRLLYQRDLRFTHARLGAALSQKLDFESSNHHYREAEAAAARSLALEPKSLAAKRDWHISLLDRADALERSGDYAAAEKLARQALALLAPVAKSSPNNALAQRDLAIAHSLLGVALIGLDRLKDGQKSLEASLALRERILAQNQGSALVSADIPVIASLLIINAERLQKFDEAGRWCDHLIQFFQGAPGGKKAKAQFQATIERLKVSIEAYAKVKSVIGGPIRKGTEPPALASRVQCIRAHALARSGKAAEAIQAIDEARAAFPKNLDVLIYQACIYSFCSRAAAPGDEHAKRIEAAIEATVQIARQDPYWRENLAYYPELKAVLKHPGFAARLAGQKRP